MSKRYASLSLAILAGLTLSSVSYAQFEEVFGPDYSKDEGHRRVAPVVHCPSRGYIAIGSRSIGVGGTSYVYLVRTDNGGATLWENYYDVGADFESDEGFALAELSDGTGFMTTGTSKRGSQWAAHVMRVDCDGQLLFSHFYYPPFSGLNTKAVGHDIRQAAVGNGITTNPGDFLIAGYLENPSPPANGVLFRIDPAGNLIWHNYYDTGSANDERFFGLTEARPTSSGPGDVVAVGEWNNGGRTQALVVRVNGDTGQLSNPLLHCLGTYGDIGSENFQSVIEVATGSQTNQFVMAGMSSSPGFFEDVYMIETKPNPCVWTSQVTIGNENQTSYREWATDLIEVLVPVAPGLGVPTGSIALTGYVETEDSVGDAFLLFTLQGSLFPITARRYGDHKDHIDFGTSLAQNGPAGPQPQGFIIAGTTFTDWVFDGDPIDLYLIQPNNGAKTGCQELWTPDVLDWTWEPRQRRPRVDKVFVQEEVHFWQEWDDTVHPVCY